LALLFIPFVFLAPRFWLSSLYQGEPKSGSKKNKWYKQEIQNLGARKTNGINRRANIWEQEKQMV
jgi:hypothetical protein